MLAPTPPPPFDVTHKCSTPLAVGPSASRGLSTACHIHVPGPSQHTSAPASDHIVVVGFTGRWPTAAHRRQTGCIKKASSSSAERRRKKAGRLSKVGGFGNCISGDTSANSATLSNMDPVGPNRARVSRRGFTRVFFTHDLACRCTVSVPSKKTLVLEKTTGRG